MTETPRDPQAQQERSDDTWVDNHGTTWHRPTAWAYAQVCRTNAEYKARAELAETRLSALTQAPTELQIAERIARQAHEGQQDTVTGAPYITHVERVVSIVAGGEHEQAAAWLHDVLEDSDFTESELRRAGISWPVREAVVLLSRGLFEADTRDYSEYINNIRTSKNRIALAVKLADLSDHLHANCPERLRPRYEAAWKALTGFDYVRP